MDLLRLPGIKMIFSLRLMCLVLCLISSVGHLAWADGAGKSRIICTLPYEKTANGLILVSGTINKTTHAKFLIDTGTSTCFVSERLASKLKLARSFAVHPNGKPILSNGVAPFFTIQIHDLAVGYLDLDGKFGVMAKKRLDIEQLGADGIIGVNYLKDKALALYPAQHLLQVYVSGNLSPDEAAIAGFGPAASVAPILREPSSGIYRCRMSVSGPAGVSDTSVLLDTGADMTNISSDTASAVGLVPVGTNQTTMFNRQFENSIVQVPVLKFGNFQTMNIPVNITHVKPDPNHSLGMDILGGYNVLMDFPASKVYLMPETSPAIKSIGANPSDLKP